MRTTLTVDDDLFGMLKERAERRGMSFKAMLNEILRIGLGAEAKSERKPPKVIPHSFGFRADIDLDKMGRLADELEAEAFAESFRKQTVE